MELGRDATSCGSDIYFWYEIGLSSENYHSRRIKQKTQEKRHQAYGFRLGVRHLPVKRRTEFPIPIDAQSKNQKYTG